MTDGRPSIEYHLNPFVEHGAQYMAGWYFRDEAGSLSGPFESRFAAKQAFHGYLYNSLGDKAMQPMTQAEADTLDQIFYEYRRARQKFPAMRGPHEGHAVIREEFEEMWDEIKANNIKLSRKECLQLAAMTLAYLLEVKDERSEATNVLGPGT